METTINGGDGRVHFVQDPATGKITFFQGDNVKTFDMPAQSGGDGAQLLGSSAQGNSDEELLDEVDGDNPPRRRIEMPAPLKPVWVCKLDHAGLTAIGIRSLRDKSGMLSLEKPDHMRALTTACLQMACEHEDGRPYFGDTGKTDSWVRAWRFAGSKRDERIQAVAEIFAAVTELNPLILNKFGDETPHGQADDALPLGTPPS